MESRVVLVLALLVPAVLAQSSVIQRISSSPQFTGFVKLLEHADVVPEVEDVLRSGKSLTVLAPTDDSLFYHTSPTLLAFLKLKENKHTLRQVLLHHFLVGQPSPFEWNGAVKTLAGDDLSLSMDAEAFHAQGVALTKFNAMQGCAIEGCATVHSLANLIVPPGLATSASMFVFEDSTDVRRVLRAEAPAPSMGGPTPTTTVKESGTPPSGAFAQAGTSLASLVGAAILAAAVLL